MLSTPIAESSLTIEGVRVVVDGGWARAPRFDAASGMDRLQLVRISRASADQRRGRAGAPKELLKDSHKLFEASIDLFSSWAECVNNCLK